MSDKSYVHVEQHSASLIGLLGIVFIVLKLTGFINWSWWLVLLPFYGGFALLAVVMLIALLFISLYEFFRDK